MKNQKGSVTIWVLVILIIAILAGGAYWYWTQNSTQQTPVSTDQVQTPQTSGSSPTNSTQTPVVQTQTSVTSQTSANSSAPASPSISINASSLVTSSHTPTISGTASGLTSVIVEVANSSYGSVNTQASVSTCQAQVIADNTWSCAVASTEDVASIPSGTYTIYVSSIVNGKNAVTPVKGTLTVK